MRALLSALGGAAATLILVLSCSDDSPQDVDAATNCEPPLTGRISRIEDVRTAQGGTNVGAGVTCPLAATLLGGGCELAGPNTETLFLNMAGFNVANNGYGCQWGNPASVTVQTVKAWAVCLAPAS